MKAQIKFLPPSESFTPEQALQSALQFAQDDDLQDVLIVGHDGSGELLVRSSKMSCQDAFYLAEKLKNYALGV